VIEAWEEEMGGPGGVEGEEGGGSGCPIVTLTD